MEKKNTREIIWDGVILLVGFFIFVNVSQAMAQKGESVNFNSIKTDVGKYNWTIQTIDTGGGTYSSIEVDAFSYPHISYSGNTGLKYAHYNGTNWHIETVDSSCNGRHTSLALDNQGSPHISYYDDVNSALKYAYYDGVDWHIETVDSAQEGPGNCTSIALDNLFRPHISYCCENSLKYAYYDGANWNIEIVDDGSEWGYPWYYIGVDSTLVLDEFSHPHILYCGLSPIQFYLYAHYNGVEWVRREPSPGFATSLDLDSSGSPHFCYYYYAVGLPFQSGFFYDVWGGIDGGTETSYPYFHTGATTSSLALDKFDNPHFAYTDGSKGEGICILKHAYYDSGNICKEIVDSDAGKFHYPCLSVDENMDMHLSYYDANNNCLKYAYGFLPNNPPILDPIGDKEVNEAELLEFTITATDPDEHPLSFSAYNLPEGADFNPDAQVFSWTPHYIQAGKYRVRFKVEDGQGGEDSEAITITVNNTFANITELALFSKDITFSYSTKLCKAIVHNIGDIDLTDIKLSLYDGDPGNNPDSEKKIKEEIISEISALSSIEIIFDLSSYPKEEYHLFAWIDPYNEITEEDEGNNIAFKYISFEWPMFRHDPQHTGYSPQELPDVLDLLWSYQTGGKVYSSSAIANGKVFVGSDDNYLYCLNENTGELFWRFYTGSYNVVSSSPIVANGKVFFGCGAYHWGNFYCLSEDTGELIWEKFVGGATSSPLISNGKVFIGSWDSKLYCLDENTGETLWTYQTNNWIGSSPAISDGKVFFGSGDSKVYCLDETTGRFIWMYETKDWLLYSSPTVSNGKVFIGGTDYIFYCLNEDTGELIWSYQTGGRIESSPAISNNKVFFGSADGRLYCLDEATGAFLWSYQTGGAIDSSPAVSEGKVFVGSYDKYIYCLDEETGELIWSYQLGGLISSSPSIANGRIFIGSWDGKIYCFSIPPPFEKRINCGGGEYIAYNGDFYLADQEYSIENGAGFVGGYVASTSNSIDNTEDDFLYQSEHWGISEYKFDVLNGFYNVTLNFAETYFTHPNERVFDVFIEGKLVLKDFDIYSQAGFNTALDYQFITEVSDGQLNITTSAIKDLPKFCAISVVSSEKTSGSISGKVTLQGRKNHSEEVIFVLNSLIESSHSRMYKFITDADGNYSFDSLVPGIYNLSAKTSNTLKSTEVVIEVIEGKTAQNIDLYLRGGDADNDNIISPKDFSILSSAYGSNPSSPNWDKRADFDNDNLISPKDFSILSSNYRKDGIEPKISITSPQNRDIINTSDITVTGIIDDNSAQVVVNDIPAIIASNTFTAKGIPLSQGENRIIAIATDRYGNKNACMVTVTSPYQKRINCGGEAYTDTNGKLYLADIPYSSEQGYGFIGGNSTSTSDPIDNTEDDLLYQSQRRGVSEYKFNVPNGFYDVTLKFAEIYFNEANKRAFDVTLENHKVLKDFDVYAIAGHDTALDKEFTVKVSDGQLNITAQATIDATMISAISVVNNQEVISGYPSEILEDFDGQNKRVAYWWNSDTVPVYARTLDNQIYHDGFASMKVDYDKLEGFPYSFFGLHPKNNVLDKDFSKFNKIVFWVYTDNPQLTIKVKFEDSFWRSWEQDFSSTKQGEWERFVYDFSDSGNINLRDIQKILFFVAPGQVNVSGTFYIDGLTLISSKAYVPLSTQTPEITTPGNTIVYGEYSVEWTDESNNGDGATIYEIWESSDSNFSNPKIFWRNDPSLDFLQRTATGIFYYKVRAWTNLPEDGGTSSGFSNVISLEIIDGPPVIDEVYSLVGGDSDNNYPVGSYVKVCVKERFDALDIASGTVRITSASQDYDSGAQNVTISSDGSYYFYHWDTNGLNPANDYVVSATLTDAIGQTDSDGSDADPDLTITLNSEKPSRAASTSVTDISIKGRAGMGILFARYYHSDKWDDSNIGYNWTHNYDTRLKEGPDGSIEFWDEQGYWYFFTKNSDGSYNSPPGKHYNLVKNSSSSFTLKKPDNITYNFLLSYTQPAPDPIPHVYYPGPCVYIMPRLPIATYFNLASIHDTNGNQITLTYNTAKLLTAVTDPSGRQISFDYYANKKIKSITDFDDRVVNYEYDSTGNLIKVTDPAGKETNYSYDGRNLTTITNPRGYHTYFAYVGDKILSQTNDNEINYTTYTSAENPNRIITTDARGHTTTYINQDATHYSIVDALGYTTAITTDDQNNPLYVTNANDKTSSYTWDAYGNPLTQTDPYNKTTTYTYEPDFHKIASRTDANGNEADFTYDDNGNPTEIKDAYDNTITMTYDQYGQVLQRTDKNGNITKYEYNANGAVTKITRQMGATPDPDVDLITTLQYDTRNNLTSLTDPKGHTTTFDYNVLDRLIRATDALGGKVEYGYDDNGNVVSITYKDVNDTTLQTVTKTYDEADRLKTVTDNLNNTTTYDYDKKGNLVKVTDAMGNMTTFVYDERDLLISRTDANGHTTTYDYWPTGKLKSIKDANNRTTLYSYDDADRIKTVTYPDLSQETYDEYDNVGNLLKKINRAGEPILYAYDDLNRLETKTYPNTSTVAYSYDDGSRLLSATDSNGTISYGYDRADRLLSVTDVYSKVVSYEYDKAGNKTKLTYPDSAYITHAYDALNRLTNIKNSSGDDIAVYQYDALSRRASLTLENGTQTTYGYDAVNRLTNLVNKKITPETILSSFGYTLYDNAGNNLTKVTLEGTFHYLYNDTYELTQVTDPQDNVTTYNYDGVRNRTTAEGQTYTANNLNQYTTIGQTSYTYDSKGNLTSDGAWTYGYDYENRLISATDGETTATYTYDYSGRRIAKAVDGITTRYVYDNIHIIAEYDSSGALLKKNIFGAGIDEILSTIDYGLSTTYYYHKDRLGSTVTVTDSSADIVEKYFYDAYGNVIIKDTNDNVLSQSAINNRYLFTGREYDRETGLYHYRARMYSPALGRFLQTDPIGYYDSANLYQYCHNNPINYTDPFGLCEKSLDEKIEEAMEGLKNPYAEAIQGIAAAEIMSTGIEIATAGMIVSAEGVPLIGVPVAVLGVAIIAVGVDLIPGVDIGILPPRGSGLY